MKKMILSSLLLVSMTCLATPIDAKKSSVGWKGTKVTGEHFGTIGIKSGDIQEKDGKLTGGEVIVDMNDISCEDLKDNKEYHEKLVGHLKSPDFFDVKKYPFSTLKITKVEGSKASGEMTIKGKKNPVSFDFSKSKEGYYTGKLVFDRTKFDMVYNSGNFFKDLGDKMIHNDVTLTFNIVAEAATAKK